MHIASMLLVNLPSIDAVQAFFNHKLRLRDIEAIDRVVRGESTLVRMVGVRPVAWARRPIFTCERREGGGVHVLLGDLDLAAPTPCGVVAKCEATRASRPKGEEVWLIDEWIPSGSIRVPPPPLH